jgi:hypothetical protein
LIATALVVPGVGAEPLITSVDVTVPPLPVTEIGAQSPFEQLRVYTTPLTVLPTVAVVGVPLVPLAGFTDRVGACTVREVVATTEPVTWAVNVSTVGAVFAGIEAVWVKLPLASATATCGSGGHDGETVQLTRTEATPAVTTPVTVTVVGAVGLYPTTFGVTVMADVAGRAALRRELS